ncbi:hypothetical protein V8E54_014140 [Elaphomyces granulatus]
MDISESRHCLAIDNEFKKQRPQLKDDSPFDDLQHDRSVARCNSLPILAIIGHWLTMEFEYRQQNSRDLTAVKTWLPQSILELDLVPKLLSIAGANAGNSEIMFSNLHRRLPARIGLRRKRETEG